MSFEIKGLKETRAKLEKILDAAKKMEDKPVPLSEVLTNEFIQENSSFNSLEDLIKASGFVVESKEDFEKIPAKEWDDFISKSTKFQSWKEMIGKAGAIYTRKNLGL